MKVQVKQRILVVSFSIIIITHGREELLMKCLDSLRPNESQWQLILYANGLGLSEEILLKARALTTQFTLVQSEEQHPPGRARNLAMETAEGEWIYFIDDDAYVLPGYWDLASTLLQKPNVEVLGGPDSPAKGMSALSLSLAIALSSPFCTGTTFFRHKSLGRKLVVANEEKLTSCNLWVKRSALKDVRFPEDYIRAEETLFLQELKAQGAGVFYHPQLKVAHFRRTHFAQLWRPTFYAGVYRSRLMREKVVSGGNKFWLPSIFVLLHLTMFIDPITFWVLAQLYVGTILFVSLGLASRERKTWLFPIIAFLHYFVVFMYGVGFLVDRVRPRK